MWPFAVIFFVHALIFFMNIHLYHAHARANASQIVCVFVTAWEKCIYDICAKVHIDFSMFLHN